MKRNLNNDMNFIVIACCSYKRPALLDKTIGSLLDLYLPENIKTEILIVDNDKEESAKNVVFKYMKSSRIKIHYTVEGIPGLATARNKALDKALSFGASHIIFIDDDEIADKNWLMNHIDFLKKYENISVSSGPTYKRFDKEYPKYITENNLFKKFTTKKNGQLRNSCATGNVFFPLALVKEHGIYFSEEFNFQGGEDCDFFGRINQHGFNIGWNSHAVNYELINEERANLKWVFERFYNDGYSAAIVKFIRGKNRDKRIFYISEKLILTMVNILTAVFSVILGPTCFINCMGLTLKNAGKFVGAVKLTPVVYYQTCDVKDNV